LGGLLGSILTLKENGLGVDEAKHIPQAMVAETIGAFFVAFLYLTQTEQKTKLSNDPAITTLIIASSYLAAMMMVCGPDSDITPLNPAVGLGTIFQQFLHGNADAFARFYIYLGFPLLGGFCAVVFHEFVYKRVSETIQESEEVDQVLSKNDDEDVIGIQKAVNHGIDE
jgi:glycerol uptake facilitator-like aquaporin